MTAPDTNDLCWCETDDGVHHDACELAPMPTMTKQEFVDGFESAASAVIDDYVFFLNEGATREGAKEQALEQAVESATCYAGIGSCGGGGCKHG